MSKRTLSPSPSFLPPAKRLHTTSSQGISTKTPFSFNDSLYDELILSIFSHLSWVDLCAVQATSTNWCRLASDNALWKNLYIKVFGRSRLRGSRGYVARSDGREVRPLPGRSHSMRETAVDWKWMFRISSNWKKGRCAIEELENGQPVPAVNYDSSSQSSCETHVLLAGPLTIVASSLLSNTPVVNLSTSPANDFSLTCESRNGGGPCQITTLAIDQSPPTHGHLRLAVFLSGGEFTVFSINPAHLSASSRRLTYLPSRARPRGSPVVQAVYHHPLLVTLSQTFILSLYDLSGDNVVLTQTLTSFTSYLPSSIVLSATSSTKYKLVLAYTVPVYPAHWSIGATELVISGPRSSSKSLRLSLSDQDQMSPGPMSVISTRTTRALDVPSGFFDDEKLRCLRDQYSRRVSCITDTQTDGKWVVLAPAEAAPSFAASVSFSSIPASINTQDTSFLNSSTSLQLYRLYLPPTSNSVAAPAPKLTFVRSLHGQTGPIASLALSDGRCVSLGLNGSLWVWDLEAGTGAEVSGLTSDQTHAGSFSLTRMVAFDDRRIVTTNGSQVFIHRFDI